MVLIDSALSIFSLQVEILEQWALFEPEWKCGLITRVSDSEKEEETKEAMLTFNPEEGKEYLLTEQRQLNWNNSEFWWLTI